ncbi:MAG: asparaginase [Turicibacter sp.]|nr:asparaginase [Turicibacter sp.]
MKKIAVFHTGGTISMKQNVEGGVQVQGHSAVLDIGELMQPFFKKYSVELIENPIFEIASPQMNEATYMLKLQQSIMAVKDEVDGVVISHGTDTLEETAYFLDITVPHTLPIVLIGAMRPLDALGSDAVVNYQNAIIVAMSDEAKGMGTLVVMNEEIHAARSVTKTNTTNLATFASFGFGYMGTILADGRVMFGRTLPHSNIYSQITKVDKKVILITTHTGMDTTVFDALEMANYPFDGLVMEVMGAGNVPECLVVPLQKIEKRGIPIVLATRCISGYTQPIYGYYGGGKSLKRKELKSAVFSNYLSATKARLKLAVLLSLGIEGIEEEFLH